MTWEIKPGVRQDHRGRFYQIAVNSHGRQDRVPYQADGAGPARMIPVPVEYRVPRRTLTIKGANMNNRRMHVEFRLKGEAEVRSIQDNAIAVQAFVDQHRAMCALRKNEDGVEEFNVDQHGNPQAYIVKGDWDYFVQYHVEVA